MEKKKELLMLEDFTEEKNIGRVEETPPMN